MVGKPDLLIVGAGPVGSVVAERCASELGWNVWVIDRRPHVAGNCHDAPHDSGVLIHKYGPHCFCTSNESLYRYLSRFTDWIPSQYVVRSFVDGKYFPFPINLETLELFFNRTFTTEEAVGFLNDIRSKIAEPKNSEEYVLSRVGKDLYEAFYRGYTRKQWAQEPVELDVSVCQRIPIRFDYEQRYTNQRFQMMPAAGYTKLFSKMLDHPKIKVLLNTDYRAIQKEIVPRIGTIYTGPIDEYFDYRFGKLPWRSLRFDFVVFEKEYAQPWMQINYPNDFEYTRTFEAKHITGQKHPQTVVSYEYPISQGDPYYPIPGPASRMLYEKYRLLAEDETLKKRVYFCGRLATYRYINSDRAMEEALELFETLKRDLLQHAKPFYRDARL